MLRCQSLAIPASQIQRQSRVGFSVEYVVGILQGSQPVSLCSVESAIRVLSHLSFSFHSLFFSFCSCLANLSSFFIYSVCSSSFFAVVEVHRASVFVDSPSRVHPSCDHGWMQPINDSQSLVLMQSVQHGTWLRRRIELC